MHQLIQSYKTGELQLVEVPDPLPRSGGVILRTQNSLISVGTEKLMISLAQKGYIGKALARPDLVKQVVSKIKVDGLADAYKAVMSRLDTPVTLGYSSAGIVDQVGSGLGEVVVGDRIACFGDGFATHSELSFVPKNMFVKIPANVSFEEAAFVGLGSIALNAIRVTNLSFGETVVVVGLGLLGQLTVQMLKAFGCKVIGIDISPAKLKMAEEFGADAGYLSSGADSLVTIKSKILECTRGLGADAVIIMAGSQDNKPIEMAAEISRDQGRITACGMVSLDLPRQEFFKKELKVVVSRATGPGKFDPLYENKGIDYPLPYVRWTTQRNMACFLDLVAAGSVKLEKLITHRIKLENALSAYEMILKGAESYLGVLIEYLPEAAPAAQKIVLRDRELARAENGRPEFSGTGGAMKKPVGVGLVGAGLHTNTSILPILKDIKGIDLIGIADAEGFKGRHSGKKFGFKYCVSDYQELLTDPQIDAILIATRHNLHAGMTTAALQAGKHVFVEKPLAMNLDEVRTIKGALEKAGRQLLVGFNRRFSPHAIKTKQLFGEIANGVINCRVNAGFVPAESWVHDAGEGGGRVIGEVCHFVDLLQYLSGSVPVRVFAEATNQHGEDNLVISIKFQNGTVGSILYASQGDKLLPREKIEIFSGNAVCVIDNFKELFFAREGRAKRQKLFSLDRGYAGEFIAFFEAIRNDSMLDLFYDHVYTTLVTFAILDSIKTGKAQHLDAYLNSL